MNWLIVSKITQLIVNVLIVFLVLIQSQSTGLSSSFGGSMGVYRSKRGLEKFVVILTVVLGVVFVSNSLVIILLS